MPGTDAKPLNRLVASNGAPAQGAAPTRAAHRQPAARTRTPAGRSANSTSSRRATANGTSSTPNTAGCPTPRPCWSGANSAVERTCRMRCPVRADAVNCPKARCNTSCASRNSTNPRSRPWPMCSPSSLAQLEDAAHSLHAYCARPNWTRSAWKNSTLACPSGFRWRGATSAHRQELPALLATGARIGAAWMPLPTWRRWKPA
jgi:hypothetical protein